MKYLVIFLLLFLPVSAQASLTFGGATSDRVTHGSAGSLDAMDPMTVCAWVYPTTLTSNSLIASKGTTVSTGFNFRQFDGLGNLVFRADRATADTIYQTTSTPLSANVWNFTCATFDTSTAPVVHIYVGTRTTIAREASYNTTTNGSGSTTFEAAANFFTGNLNAATPANSWVGRINWVGVWKRAFSLGEIRAQQFHPHPTANNVLFTWYGFNGTGTQADWSGQKNNGTVVGATNNVFNVPVQVTYGGGDDDELLAYRFTDRLYALKRFDKSLAISKRLKYYD